MRPKRAPLYVVNGALASAVLYFALHLSAGDRRAIDWIVIGLLCAAILYNLVRASLRLHRAGGGRAVWHLQRTVLFWVVGLLNTALLRPEDAGGWRAWVGWTLLAVAALDTVGVGLRERRGRDLAAERG